MSETKRCPKCQAEIPAGAPEGLCPQCLLQVGLEPKTADAEPKTAAYSPSGSGFVPPTPESLQSAFPQLEILELLGKGGMGAVYKARQPGLDRLVAVNIYSLGVTFYEMLTGELPLGRFAAPSKKVQIDVRLDEVVLRSLEKEPEQRYQQASEIKTEVEAINLAPASSRPTVPSAGVERTNPAGLNPVTLLEATSGRRWMPLVSVAAGVTGMFIVIALSDGRNVCLGSSIFLGFMLLSGLQSIFMTFRWTVAYRGHQIAVEFENATASRRLMIDGLTAASATGTAPAAGGKTWDHELRATIQHGEGFGDEIVCSIRGMTRRCRIIALPKTAIAPAIEAKHPEQAKPAPLRVNRPWVVPILSVLVVLAAMGSPGHILYTVVSFDSLASILGESGYVLRLLLKAGFFAQGVVSVALFIAGIGLMLWRPWARQLTMLSAACSMALMLLLTAVVAILWQSAEGKGTEPGMPYPKTIWDHWFPAVGLQLIYYTVLIIYLSRTKIVNVFDEIEKSAKQSREQLAGLERVWHYLRSTVFRLLALCWTGLCLILFVNFWTPVDGDWTPNFHFNIDRTIWPYHGTSDSSVSLVPATAIYRRLVIREDAEANLQGHWRGDFGALGNRRADLVKLTYTLELESRLADPQSKYEMTVDALRGMSWRITGNQVVIRRGLTLDAEVVADWLREGSAKVAEPADIDAQARAIVGIVRRAANNDILGMIRGGEGRKPVSRLDNAVLREMGTVPLDKPLPFRDWNAAESAKVEPRVPILYFGIPLMLGVWGVGLWLLIRRPRPKG